MINVEEFKKIRVFVCVPAVGKTYLCNNNKNFIDMDELKARYKYAQENASQEQIEWLKGNRGEAVRTDATDYIQSQTLKLLETTDKILLFAPNPAIVNMLFENHIPYCLVFHSKECIKEIEQRMRQRGNQENFIRSMLDPIDEFYANSVSDTRPAIKIELSSGEYLSDIFDNPQTFLERQTIYKIYESSKKLGYSDQEFEEWERDFL